MKFPVDISRIAATPRGDHYASVSGYCYFEEPLSHPAGRDVVTLNIHGYRQIESFSCGFVVGLIALHAFFPKRCADQFYRLVRPNRKTGTSTTDLVKALRKCGVGVSVRADLDFAGIREAIDRGFPVITTVRTEVPDEHHWVVVYGYGLRPNRVYVTANAMPGVRGNALRWTDFSRSAWIPRGFGLVCWGKR